MKLLEVNSDSVSEIRGIIGEFIFNHGILRLDCSPKAGHVWNLVFNFLFSFVRITSKLWLRNRWTPFRHHTKMNTRTMTWRNIPLVRPSTSKSSSSHFPIPITCNNILPARQLGSDNLLCVDNLGQTLTLVLPRHEAENNLCVVDKLDRTTICVLDNLDQHSRQFGSENMTKKASIIHYTYLFGMKTECLTTNPMRIASPCDRSNRNRRQVHPHFLFSIEV